MGFGSRLGGSSECSRLEVRLCDLTESVVYSWNMVVGQVAVLGALDFVWRGFLAAPRASTNQASLCLAESRTVAEHDGCGNMAAHNAGG